MPQLPNKYKRFSQYLFMRFYLPLSRVCTHKYASLHTHERVRAHGPPSDTNKAHERKRLSL